MVKIHSSFTDTHLRLFICILYEKRKIDEITLMRNFEDFLQLKLVYKQLLLSVAAIKTIIWNTVGQNMYM